jgi:hypothetical protein
LSNLGILVERWKETALLFFQLWLRALAKNKCAV